MKVLIADQLPVEAVAELTRDRFEVTFEPELKGRSLAQAIDAGVEVLVVRSTPVTAEVLAAGRLKLVVRAGAGFDTIDIEAAKASKIDVANCPGKNAEAVAELAFGLMLSLDRRIPDNVEDLRRGVWNKTQYGRAHGISGRTLGLIGLGAVGREMVPRAQAFGMPVVAWSRSLMPARALGFGIEHRPTPVDVASASDIVSVHVALTGETRKLIDGAFFRAMRPGAMFINTSRAESVDEDALVSAVKDKGLRAGLDVFDGQPSGGTGTVNADLFSIDGIIGTHHIGASTRQAQRAVTQETLRIIRRFRDTGRAPNLVTEG
jgi:D-3-phosphoglycerate dehydrogenase